MKKTNESGRSMVEMLGVLAIIGVLSIGGIAGYTLAMNRYRANEVLDAASKVAIIAMSMNGGTGADGVTYKAALGDSYSVPAIEQITSNKNGVVTIQFGADYDEVRKLVKTMAGNRIGSGKCEGVGSCEIDMNAGVTSGS